MKKRKSLAQCLWDEGLIFEDTDMLEKIVRALKKYNKQFANSK